LLFGLNTQMGLAHRAPGPIARSVFTGGEHEAAVFSGLRLLLPHRALFL
jgi:hypothetical protein